ncbi:O-acetylhomoserine aminocarboxypropyltransferase/cysteine synthase family protein [Gulosibacter molinativorax]|uniref:O-acetyl-L-homoserine sulfhydrolase n=1 Tax=Gulosibacter molinativorax TaxID=256821 RepID=A0ABT7C3U3_9MICO|nr:PLP-dependent transferase [Gulosibacter molinativorax]MDJ1369906.1 O-acetyl-L-homoserine sulfhydrolase [Gulosibacter molinativorax]QUY61875.1 Homocysteine synthase [Gulosibacter molinativorax]
MTERFETLQVHAGAQTDPTTNSVITPIYNTTAYAFNSAEHAANLFALTESGNIYTRIMNPTTDVLEKRVAALEGGTAALAVSSGQSAALLAVLNIAGAGDHLVVSSSIYGGTFNLFKYTLGRQGIDVTFVRDQQDAAEWQAAIKPNTKLFFAKSIGNPSINVLDIELVSGVAHEAGLPLIVDNTVASPYLTRPFEHGADIVVHSATKYLGGHGSVVGGVIVDGGKFPWSQHVERFPGLTEPDVTYNGLSYTGALGDSIAFIMKARVQLLRDMGTSIAPQSAWQIIQGIETLSLRMERHVQNAQAIAEWLEEHPNVVNVNYPGLESSHNHELAKKYAPKGASALLTFEVAGGLDAGKRVVEGVDLFNHVVNIGDVRSIITHPASTTHAQLSPEAQLEAGVTPGLIRLSVGIEHIDDLIADLEQAIGSAAN